MSSDERYEILADLADYYATIIGRNIYMGIDNNGDFWLSANRTSGRECFESIQELEERMAQLYPEFLEVYDDGYDPLDEF
jgi:hypothetical protein